VKSSVIKLFSNIELDQGDRTHWPAQNEGHMVARDGVVVYRSVVIQGRAYK